MSWEEIAETAAGLFLSRGYDGVSLRDVADAVGIRAASLYHHCPGGKAELYAASLELVFEQHRHALEQARGDELGVSVHAMAAALLTLPPVDMQRIVRMDLPRISAEAERVSVAMHRLLDPLVEVFEAAIESGEAHEDLDASLAAASVVSLVQGLGFLHLPEQPTRRQRRAAEAYLAKGIDLLLEGALAS